MILGLLSLLWVSPADAQQICGPRDQIASALTQRYNEAPVWRGLVNPQMMMELWTSEDGTWSFIGVRAADGIACVMASGISHTKVKPPELTPGSFIPIGHVSSDFDLRPWRGVLDDISNQPGVIVAVIPYDVFVIRLGWDPGWPEDVDNVGLMGSTVTQMGVVFPMIGDQFIDGLVELTNLSHIIELMGES